MEDIKAIKLLIEKENKYIHRRIAEISTTLDSVHNITSNTNKKVDLISKYGCC